MRYIVKKYITDRDSENKKHFSNETWKFLFKKIGIECDDNEILKNLVNYLDFIKGIYNNKTKSFIFRFKLIFLLKPDNDLKVYKELKKILSNHSYIKYYENNVNDIYIAFIKNIELKELLEYFDNFHIYNQFNNQFKYIRKESEEFLNEIDRLYLLKFYDKKCNKKVEIKYSYEDCISLIYENKINQSFIVIKRREDDGLILHIGYENGILILEKSEKDDLILTQIYKHYFTNPVKTNFKISKNLKKYLIEYKNYINNPNKFTNEFLIKFIKNFNIDEFIKEYKKLYKFIKNKVNVFTFIDVL